MDMMNIALFVAMICIGIVIGLQRAYLMIELEENYRARDRKIKEIQNQIEALKKEIETLQHDEVNEREHIIAP